jgi:hypothetical protein
VQRCKTPLTVKNTNNTVTEANSQSAVDRLTRRKQRRAAKKYLEEQKRLWDAPPKMSLTDPYLFKSSVKSPEPQKPPAIHNTPSIEQQHWQQFQQYYLYQQQQLQQIQHQINQLKREYELMQQQQQQQQQMLPISKPILSQQPDNLTEQDIEEMNSYLSTINV